MRRDSVVSCWSWLHPLAAGVVGADASAHPHEHGIAPPLQGVCAPPAVPPARTGAGKGNVCGNEPCMRQDRIMEGHCASRSLARARGGGTNSQKYSKYWPL
jgi:hypothetical protein